MRLNIVESLNMNSKEDVSYCAGIWLVKLRMWAALHQSLDMVQLVIRHGANPHLMDERGEATVS